MCFFFSHNKNTRGISRDFLRDRCFSSKVSSPLPAPVINVDLSDVSAATCRSRLRHMATFARYSRPLDASEEENDWGHGERKEKNLRGIIAR